MQKLKRVGDRIKYCRELIDVTKGKLATKHALNPSTLHFYENNVKCPSEERLQKLLEIFKKEDVIVSYQWLKTGVGDLPIKLKLTDIVNKNEIKKPENLDSIELMNFEMNTLMNKYPNSIHFICNTFEMEPHILYSDWLLAMPIDKKNVSKYEKLPFLFKIKNVTYLKYIAKINDNGSFNLIGSNQSHATEKYFMPNINPEIVAPIYWIRRNPDIFL